MNINTVLDLVEGSLSALSPEEQDEARRLLANSQNVTNIGSGENPEACVKCHNESSSTVFDSDLCNPDAVVNSKGKRSKVGSRQNASISMPKVKGLKKEKKTVPSSGNVEVITDVDSQPKKPLSAYNVFFQLERKRIIDLFETEESSSIDFAKREPYTVQDVVAFVLNQRKDLLSSEPKPKRKHRKSHGKIGFAELARTIASNWKAMGAEERAIFQDYYEVEQTRYRSEMAQWSALQSLKPKTLAESPSPSPSTFENAKSSIEIFQNEQFADVPNSHLLNEVSTSDRTFVTRGRVSLQDLNANAITPQDAYQAKHSSLRQDKTKQEALLRTMKLQIIQQQKLLQEKNERIRKQMLWMEKQREFQVVNQMQNPSFALMKNDPAFLAGVKYAQMCNSAPFVPSAVPSMQSYYQEPNFDEQQLLDFDLNTIQDEYETDDPAQPVYDLVEQSFQNVYDTVNLHEDFCDETASLSDLQANLSSIDNDMTMMMMMNQGIKDQRFAPMTNCGMNSSVNAKFGLQQAQMQSMLQRQRMQKQAAAQMQQQQKMLLLRQRQMMLMSTAGAEKGAHPPARFVSSDSFVEGNVLTTPQTTSGQSPMPLNDTGSVFVMDED